MPHLIQLKDGSLLTPFDIRDLLDAVEQCAGRELRQEIESYEESKSWFYTKDEIIYKLSQGAHEQSERVQTSGTSNPVERTVLNCDIM